MTSAGWLWMYAGATLMIMEVVSPGFVVFFFGLSASTVGLIRLSAGPVFSPVWQLAAFSVLSVLYIVLLRNWLKGLFSGGVSDASEGLADEYAGRTGTVVEPIRPPGRGRVRIGDADWDARCAVPVEAGFQVRVLSRDNLTMEVEVLK